MSNCIHLSLEPALATLKSYSIERASHLLQFRFAHHLEFADWRLERTVRQLCARANRKGHVDTLSQWLGTLHQKDLHTPTISPHLAISWINASVGYGVFALSPIPAWSFLGEYTGILRPRQHIWLDENDYCFRYPIQKHWLRYFTIDSLACGNITRFINHSDHPNAEAIGVFYDGLFHIIIRSIRDIQPQEEICYHYGPMYWRHRRKRPELLP